MSLVAGEDKSARALFIASPLICLGLVKALPTRRLRHRVRAHGGHGEGGSGKGGSGLGTGHPRELISSSGRGMDYGVGVRSSPLTSGSRTSPSSSRTRGACRSGGDTCSRPDGRCIQEVSDNGRFRRVMYAAVTEKRGGINIGISTGEGLRSRRILRAMWTGYPAAP